MFQRKNNQGFTLLDHVVALSVASISAATAATYLDDWLTVSEQSTMQYSQQVAASAMHTHQVWAQAEGRAAPQWKDVVYLSGIDSRLSADGSLIIKSPNSSLCHRISVDGTSRQKLGC